MKTGRTQPTTKKPKAQPPRSNVPARLSRPNIKPADPVLVALIDRMFRAVDAIDDYVAAHPPARYPNRGSIPCPNCGGALVFFNLSPLKGKARCNTPDCVDF